MNYINNKLSEMKRAGVPPSERQKFEDDYNAGLKSGKMPPQACEYAELNAKKRDKLHDKTFAIPEERKFPIPDKGHAANALARSSGTKYEARVRAAVKKKFPGMG
jgi:hypothetical protein